MIFLFFLYNDVEENKTLIYKNDYCLSKFQDIIVSYMNAKMSPFYTDAKILWYYEKYTLIYQRSTFVLLDVPNKKMS